jgi:hypothetical protein
MTAGAALHARRAARRPPHVNSGPGSPKTAERLIWGASPLRVILSIRDLKSGGGAVKGLYRVNASVHALRAYDRAGVQHSI